MSAQARHYQIERVLGRGSFGTVYRARDLDRALKTHVALKVLRLEAGPDEVKRFRDEAALLGHLQGRFFAQATDFLNIDGAFAIEMALVNGVTLSGALRALGSIPTVAALRVTADVAEALDQAWNSTVDGVQLRVQHRDIKPSNLMLRENGDVVVLDFGLARWASELRSSSTRNLVQGTPGYLAPERLQLRCGPESDVYALGAILYRLICGAEFQPEQGDALAALVGQAAHDAHLERRLELLSSVCADDRIEALLREMLAYAADQRPSAVDVVDQCRRIGGKDLDRDYRRWVASALARVAREGESYTADNWVGMTKAGVPVVSLPEATAADVTAQGETPTSAPAPAATHPSPVPAEAAPSDTASTTPPPAPAAGQAPNRRRPWWIALLTLALGGGGVGTREVLDVLRTDADGDGVPWMLGREDCDDLDAAVRPGLPEVCDGRDNNCDDRIDDEASDAPIWYADRDEDGAGGAPLAERTCSRPAGAVATGGDCADDDPAVHGGAAENCDQRDNDCDGEIDEGMPYSELYPDADGDGYGAGTPVQSCKPTLDGYAARRGDCDDADPRRTTRCATGDVSKAATPNDTTALQRDEETAPPLTGTLLYCGGKGVVASLDGAPLVEGSRVKKPPGEYTITLTTGSGSVYSYAVSILGWETSAVDCRKPGTTRLCVTQRASSCP